MAHDIPAKVIEVLKSIGETSATATWNCHGTHVIQHKALEKIAVAMGMKFDEPVHLVTDAVGKHVVIQVTGRLGDNVQWSIGEATPYNNKNGYPFAMAEKRAKDRVILKLAGLHGYVYSEEEADDFKGSAESRFLEYNAAVREHFDFVMDVKTAVANEDWDVLLGIIQDTPNEVKMALNLAPSKGGIFTTAEVKAMKTAYSLGEPV